MSTEAAWIDLLRENNQLLLDHNLVKLASDKLRIAVLLTGEGVGIRKTNRESAQAKKEADRLWEMINEARAGPSTSEANTTKKPKKGSPKGTVGQEIEGTQSRFSRILHELQNGTNIAWTSRIKDRHTQPSFGTRKPHITSYIKDSGSAGPHAITLIGDLKPTVDDDDKDFTDAQVMLILMCYFVWNNF